MSRPSSRARKLLLPHVRAYTYACVCLERAYPVSNIQIQILQTDLQDIRFTSSSSIDMGGIM